MFDIEEIEFGCEIDCVFLLLGLDILCCYLYMWVLINMFVWLMVDGKWCCILDQGLYCNFKFVEWLIFEISENLVMLFYEVLICFMVEMQFLGVLFVLDDFGVGMIVFSYFKDFFFDLVKIDKCFICNID